MSVAEKQDTPDPRAATVAPESTANGPPKAALMNPRTRMLIEAPIAGTLVRLAAPNVLVMVAQASVGLIETYFVGQLGTEWENVGVGDVNGDGRADILFRRTTDGAILGFLMNGAQVQTSATIGQLGLEWNSCFVSPASPSLSLNALK